MKNTVDLFDPAKDAGLTQVELANLAGVSRITANKWWNGLGMPHKLHAAKIKTLMDRIATLIKAGALPLSPRIKGTDRRIKLAELVLDDVSE